MGVNRDINLCVPRLQQAWAHLEEQWAKLYPLAATIILVETFRSAAVQRAYYAQGRSTLAIINKLRQDAGLPAIGEKEGKSKITFKLPGHSKHELTPSHAFDIGFVKDKKMDYSDGNYKLAADILRTSFPDVVWGADWNSNGKTSDERFIDRPHFQV